MFRAFLFTILSGLVIAVVAAINIRNVNAREETKFIPISVLSKKEADYGVDRNLVSVPAVSVDILEDKIRDTAWTSSVPIIRYTSLPIQQDGATDQDNDQSTDSSESQNNQSNQGNGGNSHQGGNSNQNKEDKGNSNQNLNNNGKGNAGSGNNNSNDGRGKDPEVKPGKKDLPENKSGTTPDKPGKTK